MALPALGSTPALLAQTAFLDLEIDPDSGAIIKWGAVLGEEQRSGGQNDIDVLDEFVSRAELVAGHNVILHDLPHLEAKVPSLSLLLKPAIDTLYLSPLAFPANPYHKLVKDYRPTNQSKSDPVTDSQLARKLLTAEWEELSKLQASEPDVLGLYRHSFEAIEGEADRWRGMVAFFDALGARSMSRTEALAVFSKVAGGASEATSGQDGILPRACPRATMLLVSKLEKEPLTSPSLAYITAWLRVAGGNSVLPPWVRLAMPQVRSHLHELRDVSCGQSSCQWCSEYHDAERRLRAYFGFGTFRAIPTGPSGESLQKSIVEAGLRNESLLAVLPTGAGKSLCYQVPALARHQRSGALTIVVSPLQALMKDQVDGLTNKTVSTAAAALNGMLTPIERQEVLAQVRLGDVGILYVSPEQLRNRSFENAVLLREIGCWVFDEAHCLSKWGHDFRPDYLYAATFIRELAKRQGVPTPPVACFTATAKQDVRTEIKEHFQKELGHGLRELVAEDVGRPNLSFEVQLVSLPEKAQRVHRILEERLPENGAAVIFCATRKATEELSRFLGKNGWQSAHYHAGLDAGEKRSIQDRFISGEDLRVICATNAFGMGIDKDDVRLVIHADIPGSLENYVQEAGRAGRDQKTAHCILLYAKDDIETQFKLTAASRLSERDISQILKKLRGEAKRAGIKSKNPAVDPSKQFPAIVITARELLRDEELDFSFGYGARDASTRVATAISWLERSSFVRRGHNLTRVYQGRPKVFDLKDAEKLLASAGLTVPCKKRWLALFDLLLKAPADEGISADTLMLPGAPPDPSEAAKQVLRDLHGMTEAGLLKDGLLCTAIAWSSGKSSSRHSLKKASALEHSMISVLREAYPDLGPNERPVHLDLRILNSRLLKEHTTCNVERLRRLLHSLSQDGSGLSESKNSLDLAYLSRGVWRVKAHRTWDAIEATSELRRKAASVALKAILARAGGGGDKHFVDFGLSDIAEALSADMELKTRLKDPLAAAERALLFLHEQQIIILQKGLAVFRQAMTIEIISDSEQRRYTKKHYEPLAEHYAQKIFHVHVMGEYAQRGRKKIADATKLVSDYFRLPREQFSQRYFAGRQAEIARATSLESYEVIVAELKNRTQERIVSAPPNKNMLVLAGPGSGKTRVVVHRCAALLRIHRIPARGILVVCFNRSAAQEIRRRLRDLVGEEASRVTVQTYHGLAMRLAGRSLIDPSGKILDRDKAFKAIIEEATCLLTAKTFEDQPGDDDLRGALLSGFSHILVDEYQDIDEQQYALLSAITGRTLVSGDDRLSILAVGDDDQNIYSWRGSSVDFIKKFKDDYEAEQVELLENYRSSHHIISATNQFVATNPDRLKTEPIRRNEKRKDEPPGGHWTSKDPNSRGRVQVVRVRDGKQQASVIALELERLRSLDPKLQFSDVAILARRHHILHEIRAALEHVDVPVRYVLHREHVPSFLRIREIRMLIEALRQRSDEYLDSAKLQQLFAEVLGHRRNSPWTSTINMALSAWREEHKGAPQAVPSILEGLCEFFVEMRAEHSLGNGVLLTTIHSAKGLEFPHVFLADGGWKAYDEPKDAKNRLAYVAMTRAKETLCVLERDDEPGPWNGVLTGESVWPRRARGELELPEEVSSKSYTVLGMDDIFLDYAGRRPEHDPIHQALRGLEAGDELRMRKRGEYVLLTTLNGQPVAALSKVAKPVWLPRIEHVREARVLAMVHWRKGDGDEKYQPKLKVESWEVPIVEVAHRNAS